jgi:hypothetical protein
MEILVTMAHLTSTRDHNLEEGIQPTIRGSVFYLLYFPLTVKKFNSNFLLK